MSLAHLSESERHCLERYVARLVEALGDDLHEVSVFGSAARGEMWPPGSPMRSDIDLLVVTRAAIDGAVEQELIDATYPLFLECGRQLGPQFRTPEELARPESEPFVESARRDGVALWRREG